MVSSRRFRAAIVGILLLLLAVVIACGEEATETAAPAAAATPAAEVVTLPPSVTGQTPAATAAPAAAVPDTDTGPTVPQGTLDVGMAVLGPYVATLYDAGYFQNRFAELITHETLFVMGIDGEWDPRLIKSFDVSADGLTYTMYLQEGAKWHNRTNSGDWGDFNADDFIWSIGQISKEGGKHVQRGNTEKVFRCEGCELTKVDDYTVQLTRPTPTFQITWFSQAPIPGFSMNSKVHYDTVGQDVALLEDVGTAPWEMIEHKTDVRRHLKAVEDHWRNTPEFAEMIWHDIPEESTRLANFLAGDLDTGIFNSDSRQAIEDARTAGTNPDVKFMVFPAAIIQMLWHEGGHYTPDSEHHVDNPIDDFYGDYKNICDDSEIVNGVATEMSSDDRRPWISCDRDVASAEWERARKVREAMLRGIDRDSLINNIAFGEGEPWYVGIWANRGRMQQLGLDTLGPGDMDYDPAAVQELLAETGYAEGFKVRLNVRLGTGTLITVKNAVATDWLEMGLDVTLQNQPPAAYRVTSQARKVHDIYGLNDAPSFPEPLRVYSTVYTSSGTNLFGINHPDLDKFIEDSEAELDTDVRWGIQGDLAKFIYENVLSMPLYAENAVWPLGAEVDSWQASPAELDWLSYWDMPRRRR
jgi:ABC-type transport system substrate-binding protein